MEINKHANKLLIKRKILRHNRDGFCCLVEFEVGIYSVLCVCNKLYHLRSCVFRNVFVLSVQRDQ